MQHGVCCYCLFFHICLFHLFSLSEKHSNFVWLDDKVATGVVKVCLRLAIHFILSLLPSQRPLPISGCCIECVIRAHDGAVVLSRCHLAHQDEVYRWLFLKVSRLFQPMICFQLRYNIEVFWMYYFFFSFPLQVQRQWDGFEKTEGEVLVDGLGPELSLAAGTPWPFYRQFPASSFPAQHPPPPWGRVYLPSQPASLFPAQPCIPPFPRVLKQSTGWGVALRSTWLCCPTISWFVFFSFSFCFYFLFAFAFCFFLFLLTNLCPQCHWCQKRRKDGCGLLEDYNFPKVYSKSRGEFNTILPGFFYWWAR